MHRPGHLSVRLAIPDDAGGVVALLRAGTLGASDEDWRDLAPYQEALADIADSPGTRVLVVERGGEIIGMCQLLTFRHVQHPGRVVRRN
jgi:hypothetical protein